MKMRSHLMGRAPDGRSLPSTASARSLPRSRGVAEGGGLLLDGAEHDLAPGGHAVEYLGVAHGEALRLGARVDDGVDLLPLGDAALDDVEVTLPAVGLAGVVDDLVVDHGALGGLAEFRGEAVAYLQRVRRAALDDARAHVTERGRELVQLLDGRHDAGDGASEQVHVAAVAVEREAERALPDGVPDELLHLFHLGGSGLGPLERLVTHDPAAHGGVADERARVDAEALVEVIEVAPERRPLPGDALLQALHGDGLDAREHHGEGVVVLRFHRGERQRAVAEDDAGDAVLRREGAERVPGHLGVEVAVVVDEPGRDDASLSVDGALRRAGEAAHVRDATVQDAHVGDERWHARAVGNSPVLDQQVVHGALLRAVLWRKPTPPGDGGQGRGQGSGSVFAAPELIPFDTVLSRARAGCSGARVNCTMVGVLRATAACHTIDVRARGGASSTLTPASSAGQAPALSLQGERGSDPGEMLRLRCSPLSMTFMQRKAPDQNGCTAISRWDHGGITVLPKWGQNAARMGMFWRLPPAGGRGGV